jgi:hypothetical protein
MALDYTIQLPCSVREALPEEKLFALVKRKDKVEGAIAQFRAQYPHEALDRILAAGRLTISVRTPEGYTREMPVSLAQLLRSVAPLDEVKHTCGTCAANLTGRDFGCIGRVDYPVARAAEEWLLARLPDDYWDGNLVMLFKSLADLEVDGAPVEAIRARGATFEAGAPVSRQWGGLLTKKQISSSQLLHLLAFGGHLSARQAQLYTRLLGLLAIPLEPPSGDDSIEALKTFLCAIALAGRLNAGVLIDA